MKAFLVAVLVMGSASASADSWVGMFPRTRYELRFAKHVFSPRVDQRARIPLSRWYQVAPDERAVAMWTAQDGLGVYRPDGEPIFVRGDVITAFRFSPAGDRIAFATAKGIELVDLARPESHPLAELAGVDWLRFTTAGVVARTRAGLSLIDEQGHVRLVHRARQSEAAAAAGDRAVAFAHGALISIDLADPDHPQRVALPETSAVLDAELSPDGHDLLWATAKHVYLREGNSSARVVASVTDLTDLAFSADGTAWLWSTVASGAVITRGETTPLPPDHGRAQFRKHGGGVVIAGRNAIDLWEPATGAIRRLASWSSVESDGWSADLVGDQLVTLSARMPAAYKQHAMPR